MTSPITIIEGSTPPAGFEVAATLYEMEASGSTNAEALDALAQRAADLFERWTERAENDTPGTRPALADVSSTYDRHRGRYAASVAARIVVLAPAVPKPRPVDDAEQASLSGLRAPTRDERRRTLRAALARHERGEPVNVGTIWPHVVALLLDDEEAECSRPRRG